jgi:hypothetical protein
MTEVEEQLSDLLHGSVPPTQPLAYEPVVRLARTRRRRGQAIAGAALGLAGLGVGLGVGLSGGGGDSARETITARPAPTYSPALPSNELRQGGVTYAIPPGWKYVNADYLCGQQPDHTVIGGGDPSDLPIVHGCPAIPPGLQARTYVALGGIWTTQYAGGWQGQPLTWHGQPAYLNSERQGPVTTMTLAFPLLNAVVSATAPQPATARALLDRIAIHADPGFPVAKDAASIRISRLPADGNGAAVTVVAANRDAVTRLLKDLRGLRSRGASVAGCGSDWGKQPTLLTVTDANGANTYYVARFDGCRTISGGTGTAAVVSDALVNDIERLDPLRPETQLISGVAGCRTDDLAASYAGTVSPMAGERSAVINLRNIGASHCQLFGYPTVDFFGMSGALGAFAENGGPYIRDIASPVVLKPGQIAHFVLAKPECPNLLGAITEVQIQLRGSRSTLSVPLLERPEAAMQDCGGSTAAELRGSGHLVQVGPLLAGAFKAH